MDSTGIKKDLAILALGIAASLLTWVFDKGRVAVPKYILTTIGLCSIVAIWWATNALAGNLSFHGVRLSAIILCVCTAVSTWWLIRATATPDDQAQERAGRIKTELRLRFPGKVEKPDEVHADNIESWYTLWTPSAALSWQDANQKQVGSSIIIPVNWAIFAVFKKPTVYRELTVSFSDPGFPRWEIKAQTNRFFIINVSGDIPAGNLEIYAKQ